MRTVTAPSPSGSLVHSYLFLRRAVGIIGVALPAVLILGKLVVDGGGLLDSISSYYYSDMGGVFVGSMCAVGVFLLSYRGYDRLDDIAGDIGAVTAIGIALCPTTPDGPATHSQEVVGTLHLIFASIFFLTLVFFCFFLFTRSDRTSPTPRKRQRNRLYIVTGALILLCLVLIAIVKAFFDASTASLHPEVWLESIAIMSFGIAWLVKGDTLLRDR